MASAAAAMQEKGFHISGSDQNIYPPMSTFLVGRNIEVMSGYAEQNLAHRPDLVVIGNAISRGNPEAEAVLGLTPADRDACRVAGSLRQASNSSASASVASRAMTDVTAQA